MKRIIIICEGQTEQAFCNDVLQPHFNESEIYIDFPTIKKTEGGIISWQSLKKQVITHLKQDRTAFVTTLIDYYGIHEHHKYPAWEQSLQKPNRAERMDVLENAMRENIDKNFRHRFMPYIQLHEFEGLLFNTIDVFTRIFSTNEFKDYQGFVNIFNQYSNPEDINDGATSAPSKRLMHHIVGYNKVIYGASLAEEIGLDKIRQKCPRFNNWINNIENI